MDESILLLVRFLSKPVGGLMYTSVGNAALLSHLDITFSVYKNYLTYHLPEEMEWALEIKPGISNRFYMNNTSLKRKLSAINFMKSLRGFTVPLSPQERAVLYRELDLGAVI